jgi:hypothetical protein
MGASPILWFDIEWMVDREGEALAEPRRVLARRPPEALIGPPAVADLTVGLGSAGASPSRWNPSGRTSLHAPPCICLVDL